MSKKILQESMFRYVTICRFSRWGVLCLTGMLASQVISSDSSILEDLPIHNGGVAVWLVNPSYGDVFDVWVGNSSLKVEPSNGTRWTTRMDVESAGYTTLSAIESHTDKINDALHAWSRSNNEFGPPLGAMIYGTTTDSGAYNRLQYGVLGYLERISNSIGGDAVSNLLSVASVPDGSGNYITTLFGLLAGWAPNSLPSLDGIPLGVETNGIWAFEQKQVSLQESMTNQLERFLTHTSNYLERISYQLTYPYANTLDSFFYNQHDFYNSHLTNSAALLGSTAFGLDLSILDWEQILLDYQYPWILFWQEELTSMAFQDQFVEYSNSRYERYGTKWIYDALTNNAISSPVPLDDITDSTSDEIDDYIDEKQDEHETFNNEYTSVQDDRIDTSFLDDVQTAKDDLVFDSTAFDDFKSQYRSIFSFSGSSDLDYSFSFSASSGGPNIHVSNVHILQSQSSFLASSKPTIDKFLKVIITLNLFICILVLSNKAFRMVSEVFST